MERMNIYNVPHKGLRNALSQLQLLAGNCRYSDSNAVRALRDLSKAVFTILTIHAEDEDEVTLQALEQRCPGCSDHDMKDHEHIHAMQMQLEDIVDVINRKSQNGEDASEEGSEFYLAFSEFHGRYLQHTAEEERVTQPLLWKHFSDQELLDHRKLIMSRNPPETLLIWFRFVFPALSHQERVGLLSGFKAMAHSSMFVEALKVIRGEMTEVDFGMLMTAVA